MEFSTKVYSLDGFSEETKAVAMAKCSRSRNTFMEDAKQVTEAKASDFHEKIVVGFGHESVADMSIGSLCVEDVSTLAAESLLDLQTGKYQGKSSRYVPFSRNNSINPYPGGTLQEGIYVKAIDHLYDTYEGLHAEIFAYCKAHPSMQGVKDPVIRARVFDNLRYLLPLSALTNIGTRLSSRDTSALVRVLLSHPLPEVNDLGEKMKLAALDETPTLVRHAAAHNTYRELFSSYKDLLADLVPQTVQSNTESLGVTLMEYTPDAERVLVSSFLHEHLGYSQPILGHNVSDLVSRINTITEGRVRRQDPLPHAFRSVRYKFAFNADFGSFKDLRRHRRCELFKTLFSCSRGYMIPDDIKDMGGEILFKYCSAMDHATEAWNKLAQYDPYVAQYVVAHGHNQLWHMDMDLEQLYYMVELRSAPGGHISYRRIAYDMYRQVKGVHPELVKNMLVREVGDIQPHH